MRKSRSNITQEKFNMIIRLSENPINKIIDIAKMLDLDRQSVRNALKKYSYGTPFLESGKKRSLTFKNKKAIIKPEERIIFNTISCNNSLIQKEIMQEISNTLNIQISQATVSRKIKKLKISRKRLSLIPYERNNDDKINARAIYASDISRFPREDLVFVDETGFNQHTRRSYGYSVENTPAYINIPANRGKNKSMLCAIGIEGLIDYQVIIGAFNSNLFLDFIRNKLIPYFSLHPNKILIMDNVRFHHSEIVLNMLRLNNISFKFLPSYSPQLNPIEEFFSMIKSRFNALRTSNPSLSIDHALISAFESNFSEQCEGFFRNMSRWIEKARLREHFIN